MHPRTEFSGKLPERIVCLSDETTETLYLLGEQDRIVGISSHTVRPAEARKEKLKIGGFTSLKLEKILALKPDLVLGFSDLQADVASELIRAGVQVFIFNQRSIGGILNMIATLGNMVGVAGHATELIAVLAAEMERVRRRTKDFSQRPRIYFEEWNKPMISAIRWVSQLIEVAGGEDCFAELAAHADARQRIISSAHEVVERKPDIIIGSWCGKRFQPEEIKARPGWDRIPAVRDAQVFEIHSANILQPGPAALSDGLHQLHSIFMNWQEHR